MMKLLTTGNPKLLKGEALGYLSFILHLAPADLSGYNVCPGSSEGCRKVCLNTAGRGRFTKTQDARIRKTIMFFEERDKFLSQLVKEVRAGIKRAHKLGMIPCFRLNGTSDIRWENLGILEQFPDTRFYDYTKLSNRKNLPANYYLTFSLSEDNAAEADEAFRAGMNVAVVFKKVPTEWNGRPVVNGDEHDLRFLDPKGVYVGLKAKGKAKKVSTSFVQKG